MGNQAGLLKEEELLYWGDFELWDVLGRGGMATVVRALAPPRSGLPDVVALKFLHPSLAESPKALAAFYAEAEVGLHLRHENIARTFGIERHDGRSALILEYVDGRPLNVLWEQVTPFPAPEEPYMFAALIEQVCIGLDALHSARDEFGRSRNLVHRDVTPQNVLVRPDGLVQLVDLGVFYGPDRGFRTTAGFVKGKVPYLAPEYIDARPWDHRVDVWAAAVMLWELVTGKRLFQGASPSQTMSLVRRARIPSPDELRPELSKGLVQAILRGLQRDVSLRYATAGEFARTLREVIDAECPGLDRAALAEWLGTCGRGAVSGVMPVGRHRRPTTSMWPTSTNSVGNDR